MSQPCSAWTCTASTLQLTLYFVFQNMLHMPEYKCKLSAFAVLFAVQILALSWGMCSKLLGHFVQIRSSSVYMNASGQSMLLQRCLRACLSSEAAQEISYARYIHPPLKKVLTFGRSHPLPGGSGHYFQTLPTTLHSLFFRTLTAVWAAKPSYFRVQSTITVIFNLD